jgi:hypothetical protein
VEVIRDAWKYVFQVFYKAKIKNKRGISKVNQGVIIQDYGRSN